MIAFYFLMVMYCVLYFLDVIFRTCMFFPYISFLNITGITLQPFFIRWETNKFNGFISRLTFYKRSFVQKWFSFGAFVSAVIAIPCLFIVSIPLFRVTFPDGIVSKQVPITLKPLIPGSTVPISHAGYFFIAALVCFVFHELGHAIAACRARVPIDACGICVIAVFPYAYVALPVEKIKNLPWKERMHIYAAGIWHNIVLALIAMFIMIVLPILLCPVYFKENGVTVLHVDKHSGASQPAGFLPGDEIISLNGCLVSNRDSWKECLENIMSESQAGFCASTSFVETEEIFKNDYLPLDVKSNACCPNNSLGFCFHQSDSEITKCLPARRVIEKAEVCHRDEECTDKVCLLPVVNSESERFIRIERRLMKAVLFVGSVQELFSTVEVTSWASKFRILPVHYVVSFEVLLMYITGMSAGLAVVNVIPCYKLDGQHLSRSIINVYIPPKYLHIINKDLLIKCLNVLGTFLLFSNVVIQCWNIFFTKSFNY